MDKALILKWKEKLNLFLDGPLFLIALGAAIGLFWAFGIQTFAFAFLVLLIGVLLLSKRHGKAVLAVALMFIMCVSDINNLDKTSFWVMVGILASIAGGCFIYRLVRLFQDPKSLTLGRLFWGLVVAAVVSLLGGVGYSYNIVHVVKTFGWCFAGFAFYFFFVNTVHGNLTRYVAQIAVISGCVVLFEIFVYYFKIFAQNWVWADVLAAFKGKTIDLSWALSNTAAVMLALAIPFAMYLGTASKKNYLYVLLSALFVFGIIFTFSRANLLFVGILYIPILIYTFCVTKYKVSFLIAVSLIAVVLVLLFLIFYDEIIGMLVYFVDRGFDSSGRIELYVESIRMFLLNPAFGVGVYTFVDPYNLKVDWFMSHCTILQIILNFGVVGVLGYALFFFQRYAAFFRKISKFKMFAFLAVLLVELHGMIDVTFCVIYYTMYIFAFSIAAEKEPDEEREPAFHVSWATAKKRGIVPLGEQSSKNA